VDLNEVVTMNAIEKEQENSIAKGAIDEQTKYFNIVHNKQQRPKQEYEDFDSLKETKLIIRPDKVLVKKVKAMEEGAKP
jgi:hypothetical protein